MKIFAEEFTTKTKKYKSILDIENEITKYIKAKRSSLNCNIFFKEF